METTEIKAKVVEILSGMFDLKPADIPEDKPFPEITKYDSMRALELLAKLENEFTIMIDPDKLYNMYTVDKVTAVVEELLHAK
jgi:acyl carrier protein